MKMAEPYRHVDLVEFFNTEHAKMLDSINPNFEKSALWFASLDMRELTEHEIDLLFTIGAAE